MQLRWLNLQPEVQWTALLVHRPDENRVYDVLRPRRNVLSLVFREYVIGAGD
jgi:hypothetical protein